MIKRVACVAATLLALSSATAHAQAGSFPSDSLSERIARDFVKAFGERDVDGMVKVMDPRVLWMVVWGDSINVVVARGRDSLEARLRRESGSGRPTSTMTLESITVIGPWVSAKIKTASKNQRGESSETWISMLEIRGGAIVRLWQYPTWVSSSTTLPGK